MTPADLRTIGALLYSNPGWQTAMARDLGVAVRTVQSWLAGDRGIPADLPTRLDQLARVRVRFALKASAICYGLIQSTGTAADSRAPTISPPVPAKS